MDQTRKIILIGLIVLLATAIMIVYVNNQSNEEINSKQVSVIETLPKIFTIHKSVDCEITATEKVTLPANTTPQEILNRLAVVSSEKSVGQMIKSFERKENVAYLDWPEEWSKLPNIDASCAIGALLRPIEETLKSNFGIDLIIHSLEGSVPKFYERLGLVCPEEGNEKCY